MEKLSGILPSNARLRKVDLSDAHPIRPGVPRFGRPVGIQSVEDRVTLSDRGRELAYQETLGSAGIDRSRVKDNIAKEVSERFFMREPIEIKNPPPDPEQVQEGVAAATNAVKQNINPILETTATTKAPTPVETAANPAAPLATESPE